ncbi:GNAT family N-acetyltransferase [Aurantiacibacter hainanensis]|uniref:GNAT family N-acetyltransferase n=1 Tax=Aurantiacibacter hainanensis TaxID=3076114 RepID=UPI0030C682B7
MAEFRHETDRLVLRDWREADWPRFWELTNTPAVMRWLGDPADEAAKADARHRLEGYRENFGHTFWVVERKADDGHLSGELLGFCGLKRSNVEGAPVFDMPEIGWRMREDAWGRGYAKEAASASLDLGFGRFAYAEIVALTVQGNAASWGLMQRLGMVRRKDLDFQDARWPAELNPTIVYSITAQQWTDRADG